MGKYNFFHDKSIEELPVYNIYSTIYYTYIIRNRQTNERIVNVILFALQTNHMADFA